MFPLKFFLTRRRKFCSRIENGELSGERRKQLVTKFLQCLSVKQSSVKLLPTIKFPSVLELWALSWQLMATFLWVHKGVKDRHPACIPSFWSVISAAGFRLRSQHLKIELSSLWDAENFVLPLSNIYFLRVTYITKWHNQEKMRYAVYVILSLVAFSSSSDYQSNTSSDYYCIY